jgi:hypothetical protein
VRHVVASFCWALTWANAPVPAGTAYLRPAFQRWVNLHQTPSPGAGSPAQGRQMNILAGCPSCPSAGTLEPALSPSRRGFASFSWPLTWVYGLLPAETALCPVLFGRLSKRYDWITTVTMEPRSLPYHAPLCPASYRVELRFGKTCFVRRRDWCLSASAPAMAGIRRSLTTSAL